MEDLKTEGKLDRIKGRIRENWGQITDDDFDKARGNAEELIGRIKEKTGETTEEIRRRLNEFLDNDEEARAPK